MARRPKKRQKSDNSKNNNEGTYHLIASFLVSREVEGSQVNSLKTSKASTKSTIGPAVPRSLASDKMFLKNPFQSPNPHCFNLKLNQMILQ